MIKMQEILWRALSDSCMFVYRYTHFRQKTRTIALVISVIENNENPISYQKTIGRDIFVQPRWIEGALPTFVRTADSHGSHVDFLQQRRRRFQGILQQKRNDFEHTGTGVRSWHLGNSQSM